MRGKMQIREFLRSVGEEFRCGGVRAGEFETLGRSEIVFEQSQFFSSLRKRTEIARKLFRNLSSFPACGRGGKSALAASASPTTSKCPCFGGAASEVRDSSASEFAEMIG